MNKDNHSSFPNPFWDYALRVYGREAVRELCLELQDRHGADINLVLFLLWRDSRGAAASETDDLSAMISATLPVRTRAIEPLRGLRRIMKHPFPDDLPGLREILRQKILEAELSAEAVAQTLLYTRFPVEDAEGPRHEAEISLTRYLALIGMNQDDAETLARRLARATQ